MKTASIKSMTLEQAIETGLQRCIGASDLVDAEGPACDGSDKRLFELEDALRTALDFIRTLPADHQFRTDALT